MRLMTLSLNSADFELVCFYSNNVDAATLASGQLKEH